MTIQHRIEGKLVELVIAGHFSLEELLGAFRAMVEDEDLPEQAAVLINVSASKELPPSVVIHEIADVLGSQRDRLGPRLAVLVAHSVRFGLARQLGVWLDTAGLQSRPFYEREDAVAWLQAREA